MTFGRVVALEGASASGKTTLAHRLGIALDAVVMDEAYRSLRPPPSLDIPNGRALERLERDLLTAEAARWVRSARIAASGRTVVLDTGTLGPLTYTYGLVREGLASWRVLNALLPYARRLVRRGVLGLPSMSVYLDVPPAELRRRARRTPHVHPPDLFPRHVRVARRERSLLLGPWKQKVRVHRVPVSAGTSPARVVRQIRGYLRTAPEPSRAGRTEDRAVLLELLGRLDGLAQAGSGRFVSPRARRP